MNETIPETDSRVVLLVKVLASVFATYVAFMFTTQITDFAESTPISVALILTLTGGVFVALYEGTIHIMVGSDRVPVCDRLSVASIGRGLVFTLAVTATLVATTLAFEALLPGTPAQSNWPIPVIGLEFRSNVIVPGVLMAGWYELIRWSIDHASGRFGGGDSPEVPA